MNISPNRRWLASIAGGLIICFIALGCMFLGSLIAYLSGSRRVLEFLVWPVAWPFAALRYFIPNSEDPSPQAANLRMVILIAVPVLDLLAYSSLTYIFLWWRDSRHAG